MTDHTCAKCGKQLNPVNWWTAGVYDRYVGEMYKLCNECAEQVKFVMQTVIETDGDVEAVNLTFCKRSERRSE